MSKSPLGSVGKSSQNIGNRQMYRPSGPWIFGQLSTGAWQPRLFLCQPSGLVVKPLVAQQRFLRAYQLSGPIDSSCQTIHRTQQFIVFNNSSCSTIHRVQQFIVLNNSSCPTVRLAQQFVLPNSSSCPAGTKCRHTNSRGCQAPVSPGLSIKGLEGRHKRRSYKFKGTVFIERTLNSYSCSQISRQPYSQRNKW